MVIFLEEDKVFDKFCEKYLPVYFKFWSHYWLAIWCAPVRYCGNENLPKRYDTALQALRITIRKGESHSTLVATIKNGVI